MSEAALEYLDFVRLVIEALEAAGVEYLVGGAVAAWAWGEPRATQDLDLVVDIPADALGKLSSELEKRAMLVPVRVIQDAILEERADIPVNAIHMYSGFKADLYLVRPHDELRRSAFARRMRVDLGPRLGRLYLHSPEDLIVYKLWYYSLGRQTKHLRDIGAILLAVGDALDFAYIEHWAGRKGLLTLWQEILKASQ
ncbi:MAG: hypothetical protein AB1894_13285 [Chloroflexota bacterium]